MTDNATILATIRRKEAECRSLESDWEEHKVNTKAAKDRFEAAVAELRDYIRDPNQAQMEFDDG